MAEIYNFFGDIFDYLRETYWEADFGVYDSFAIRLPGMTMGQFIALLMAGLFLAGLVAFYERRYLGQFIRALLRENCEGEESAKTLPELGLDRHRLLCWHLRAPAVPLRKLTCYVGGPLPESGGVSEEKQEKTENEPPRVSRIGENGGENGEKETSQASATPAGEGEGAAEPSPALPHRVGREELLATRFYIPPALRTRAELRYRARGNGIGALCLMALACIFGGMAFVHLTPIALELADTVFVALGV